MPIGAGKVSLDFSAASIKIVKVSQEVKNFREACQRRSTHGTAEEETHHLNEESLADADAIA